MDKQFGLVFLLRTHLGVASNVVQPIQREESKSIGAERQVSFRSRRHRASTTFRTFHALSNKTQILRKLEEVAGELGNDMVREGWTGKTVTLKYKLDTFQGKLQSVQHVGMVSCSHHAVFTRAKSFDRWVSANKEDLFAVSEGPRSPVYEAHVKVHQIGKELLLLELPLTLRLIGLRVTKLKDLHAPEPAGGIKQVCFIIFHCKR
jgi:DNA polymerase kappa